MTEYNVAVFGATGAVGRQMVKILEERDFPVKYLKLLATSRSAGLSLPFRGEEVVVEETLPGVFKGVDIVLASAGSGPSREISPRAVKEGAVVIDNSNAFRMEEGVPLVVPEINPEDIFKHRGIIANPNCSTIQMVLVLKPIYDRVGLERIVVSTYQAVSGTGKKAIDELKRQLEQYLADKPLEVNVYPHQIALNVLPQIDVFSDNGYTVEEMKMVRETRKILHDSSLRITATAARVPVLYGHSEALNIETGEDISPAEVRELLSRAPGVKVVDNPAELLYPQAVMSENDDDVLVGRIRKDISVDRGLTMWIVGNNLRKGAALNAVQIAERLIQGG